MHLMGYIAHQMGRYPWLAYGVSQMTTVLRGRLFSGAQLSEIAFPLGGIGTGTVSLGGRGQLRDWEIFNRPGKGKILPSSFVALWLRPEGDSRGIVKVVEGPLMPPYRGSS